MAYDQGLAERVRERLADERDISEKRMFGGLAFLRGGKLFVCIWKDDLMVRVGPAAFAAALQLPHTRPMEFSNKNMKLNGYVLVSPAGVDFDEDLGRWLERAFEFARSQPKTPPPKAARAKAPRPKAAPAKRR